MLLSQSSSGHAWQGAYLHGVQPAGTAPQPAQAPPAAPPSPFSGVRRHPAGVQRQSDPRCTAGGVLFCGCGGAVPKSPAYPGTGQPESAGALRVGQSKRPARSRYHYKAASSADGKYFMHEGFGWWVRAWLLRQEHVFDTVVLCLQNKNKTKVTCSRVAGSNSKDVPSRFLRVIKTQRCCRVETSSEPETIFITLIICNIFV